jgi:hypothetical protein
MTFLAILPLNLSHTTSTAPFHMQRVQNSIVTGIDITDVYVSFHFPEAMR